MPMPFFTRLASAILSLFVAAAIACLPVPAWAAETAAQLTGLTSVPPEAAAYYAMLVSLLVFLGLIALSVGETQWAAYAGVTVLLCTWMFFNEQVMRGAYWLGIAPPVRLLILAGHLIAALYMVVGALAIPSDHGLARLKPWFLAGAALAIVFGALDFMAPVGTALAIYNVTILVAICLQFIPFWSFKRIAGERRVPVLVVAAAVTLLLTGLYIFIFRSTAPSAGDAIILNRGALAWLVVFGSFMSMRRIIALRDDRTRVLSEALAAAEKESELNKALLDAERNYARAREVAARQRERFAEASHDIKQPIASLRASVDSLAGEQSPQMRAQLQRAFDYLESLANAYGVEAAAKNERTDKAAESVPVALLLQTLERMFRAEAEAKGLTFEVESNGGHIAGDPLGIVRILSNLLSNAIHHTPSGTVRLSAAEKDDRTVFEVFSTGEAISLADIDRIFEANQKGEHSEGQGLGLAIVKRIAQSASLPLELRTLPGEGNSFSLSVPTSSG